MPLPAATAVLTIGMAAQEAASDKKMGNPIKCSSVTLPPPKHTLPRVHLIHNKVFSSVLTSMISNG